MRDIIESPDGEDLRLFDTQTSKAANILGVQLGALEYAPDLGIDLNYFLQEGIAFQNESFKGYIVEVLATNGINVTSLTDILESLYSQYVITLSPPDTSTGLIAR